MHTRTINRLRSEGYKVVKNDFSNVIHWVVISYQYEVGMMEIDKATGERSWWLSCSSGRRKVSQRHFMRRLTED